jgi:Zn-finger nucleic acid-binding protein
MADNAAFTCPRCRTNLRSAGDSGGIAWTCPACNGIAISVAVLRQRFTNESINPFWQAALNDEGTLGCDCPACGKSMREVQGPQLQINVDVCRSCQFVWLDSKEIDKFTPKAAGRTNTESELPLPAREAIGMARMRQIEENTQIEVNAERIQNAAHLHFTPFGGTRGWIDVFIDLFFY